MSVRTNVHVDCDECLNFYDYAGSTVAEARSWAQQSGGFHRSKGKDICPDCWDAGKR